MQFYITSLSANFSSSLDKGLKEAHHQLDLAIEKCYSSKAFENDKERLEYLFKMYEEMIKNEKNEKYNT